MYHPNGSAYSTKFFDLAANFKNIQLPFSSNSARLVLFRVSAILEYKGQIMTKTLLAGVAGILCLGLGACVHVDEGDWSDAEEISRNTETALRVCGGPGTVAEVTDEGFTCKTDD